MPGSLRSSRRMSGTASAIRSRASSPVSAVCTSKRDRRVVVARLATVKVPSTRAIASRIPVSSSTTSTRSVSIDTSA